VKFDRQQLTYVGAELQSTALTLQPATLQLCPFMNIGPACHSRTLADPVADEQNSGL